MTICRSSDVQRNTDRRLWESKEASCCVGSFVPRSSARQPLGSPQYRRARSTLTPADCLGSRRTVSLKTIQMKNKPDDDDPFVARKSAKRGLSYDLLLDADFDALSSGVSWWYNWHYRSDASDAVEDDYAMQFVPMLQATTVPRITRPWKIGCWIPV